MIKQINKTLISTAVTVAVVGITVLIVRETAKAAVDKSKELDFSGIDPLNPDNVFMEYFTKGYQAVTGSNQTLGADIYDWTHKSGTGVQEGETPESTYGEWTLESSH